MKNKIVYLVLPILLLTSCTSNGKRGNYYKEDWHFVTSRDCRLVYHHKEIFDDKEITYEVFKRQFLKVEPRCCINEEKNPLFEEKVKTLAKDLSYKNSKTVEVYSLDFNKEKNRFNPDQVEYTWFYSGKENKDIIKENTGIRTYDMKEEDQYYDHLYSYYVKSAKLLYVIEINGGKI